MSGRSQARDELRPPRGGHPSRDELSRFVIDVLDAAARRQLERHVALCPACAEALAREAAAEMELLQLWPAVERPLAPVLTLPVPARALAVAPPPAPPASPKRDGWFLARSSRGRVNSSALGSFAAAAMTLLFAGYWSSMGTPGGGAGAGAWSGLPAVAAWEATGFGDAVCTLGEAAEAGLCVKEAAQAGVAALLAAPAPAQRRPPMCTSPESCAAGLEEHAPAAPAVCRAPAAGICAVPLALAQP